MSTFKNDYINKNKYTRPGFKGLKRRGIVLHYTASPGGSAANHKSYFGRGADGRYAGAHIFIDPKEALCIVPLDEVAYHANESNCRVPALKGKVGNYYGDANVTTVGIEMCIEKNGSIAAATFNRTVEVTAELCKKYGLNESDLYRHYDITRKNCPAPWVSNSSEWARFKKAVKKKLRGKEKPSSKPSKPSKPSKSIKGKMVIIKVGTLNFYNGPRWTNPTGTVKKGDVFTIDKKVMVNGYPMYKLKAGNYITASNKYVTVK